MSDKSETATSSAQYFLGFYGYLGGAFFVGHQPGCGFWDGVVWLWYVGRYVAAHFTLLTYN